MPDFLELTVDKFTFRVATDRLYSREGVWAQPSPLTPLPEGEGNYRVRVGLSDFAQQRSGDVAFAEAQPVGTRVSAGDEIASIETIKVTLGLGAPAGGIIVEVNPALATTPEVINHEPYGDGWLVVIEASDWDSDRARLLDAPAYFDAMLAEAEAETKTI